MRYKSFFKDVKEMAAGGMEDYDSPFDTVALLAEVIVQNTYIYKLIFTGKT